LKADFDTQISIYSGECGALTCITGNDQAPPLTEGSSVVNWDTTEGETYFILVLGYNSETGEFQIDLDSIGRPDNNECPGAIELEVGDTVADSTLLATYSDIETCGDAVGGDQSAPSLFYRVTGDGRTIAATITATYDMQVSIFSGSCDAPVCVDGTEGDDPLYRSGQVAWDSVEGETYYVIVHGFMNQIGDYELTLSEVTRPSNDLCEGASELQLNSVVNGTTVLATFDGLAEDEACGAASGGDFSAPGVWYALIGTGGTLSATINGEHNVQISIFTGESCESRVCVDGKEGEEPDYKFANIVWDSEEGATYYILVHGSFDEVGSFQLQVTEATRPENNVCATATALSIGTTVSGRTNSASLDSTLEFCGGTNPNSAPGVWFSLMGSGETLTASFEAAYDAQLTLYSGDDCGALTCVDGTDGDSPLYTSGSIRWNAEAETMYYLYVHGFNLKVGEFELTVAGGTKPSNDECASALLVTAGQRINGTTISATQDDIASCGR
jgi:hypothetical protein